MSKQDWNQSQYYQEDFLASHSVQPGSEEARKMTVTSGQRCLELYRRSDPVGSLVRMLLASSVWRSTQCYLTWKTSATPAKRLLFRLVPSMPRTGETVAPLWPTVCASEARQGLQIRREGKKGTQISLSTAVRLWPTPSASDCGRTAINPILTSNGTIRHRNKAGGQSYARLDAVAAMFPTPTARCSQFPCQHGKGGPDLATSVGGQLNPMWVEWLMGLPLGWTSLDASETLSCPSSSSPSSEQ